MPQVAEAHPRFMRRQLGEVVAAMLQIAGADALDDATRQLAAEFLITLCEARDKAPGMMRKLPSFAEQIFQIMLKFLLDIEVRRAALPAACSTLADAVCSTVEDTVGRAQPAHGADVWTPCRTIRSGTGPTATSTRTRARGSCTSLARSAALHQPRIPQPQTLCILPLCTRAAPAFPACLGA
jgi:Importin repeat